MKEELCMPYEQTMVLVVMLEVHATSDLVLARCIPWHIVVPGEPVQCEQIANKSQVLYWTCRFMT